MGLSQQHYRKWVNIKDIVEFSCTLGKDLQIAFMFVFSALSWTLWKLRNEMYFQHTKNKTFRTIILMIIVLVNYWIEMVKRQARDLIPVSEDIEVVPLQIWDPEDTQFVVY